MESRDTIDATPGQQPWGEIPAHLLEARNNPCYQIRDSAKRINELSAKLEKYSLSELVRKDLGDELNFEAGTETFVRTFHLLKELQLAHLNELHHGLLTSLASTLREVDSSFAEIMSFTGEGMTDKTAGRDQRISRAYEVYGDLFRFTKDAVFYSATEPMVREVSGKVQQLHSEATTTSIESRQLQATIRSHYEELDKDLQTLKTEMSQRNKKFDDLFAELGVKGHSKRFKEQADKDEKFALLWMASAGILLAAVVGVVLYFESEVIGMLAKYGWQAAAVASSGRVLLVSALSVMILFCVRNYSASRHNGVVNRHRQHALDTFEIFRDSAQEPETKEIVLTNAMGAIFAPQSSGFLKAANEPPQPPQVIEMLRPALKGD